MSKRIPLSRGKWTLISDEDYERVSQYKWSCDGNGYAVRNYSWLDEHGKRKRGKIMLHRFILDAPSDMHVDHINHNKLDNRRCNMRLVTPYMNHANSRAPRHGKSRFKGVHFNRGWVAQIRVRGHKSVLGTYKHEEDAALAYDRAAYEAWGECAYLNFREHRELYLSIQT